MRDYTNIIQLIEILTDGQFHSGEELGTKFGITRAGINKYIKVLRAWGINLQSIPRKGYCLEYPLDLLNQDKIDAFLSTPAKAKLALFPIIDSTNQYLLSRLEQWQRGDACVAEYQQAGRGRRGRQWYSPFASNLYLSMYWRLDQGPAAAMGLSLVIGIIIAEELRKLTKQDIKVKWPNDLYLEDKKLAGILVEISAKTGDYAHIVLGTGINLAMHKPDSQIVNQHWANLGAVDRNELVAVLLQALRTTLPLFEKQGLASFISRWRALDNFQDRPVKLLIGNDIIKGIARGIDAQGALLLEQDGKLTPYIGGEISLRADNDIEQ